MSTDVSFQFDILVRLIAAALVGAGLGLERELHGHQAGMRTHMRVALGSAVFNVLSIYGFAGAPGAATPDPTRISAQIVTGMAASLWVVASVGVAAGPARISWRRRDADRHAGTLAAPRARGQAGP